MGSPAQDSQCFCKYAHNEGKDPGRPLIPELFDQFTQTSFGHDLRLHAAAQALQGTPENAQSGPAERTVGVPQVAGKAQEAHRFGRKEMTERMIAPQLRTPQQVRQALFTVEVTKTIGQ